MYNTALEAAIKNEFIREAKLIEKETLSENDEEMPEDVKERIYKKLMSHI